MTKTTSLFLNLISSSGGALERRARSGRQWLEHDAEKCARFSDDIMLYFFDLDQDSDFRPIGPKIILI
ncbi:hypothetical protein ELI54_00180 [Rhizobium ruizarguesonis]|nr:hypothetical protein [Rhizobium leguminosarum bv. viciae]TAT76732.1 hypothetical protein ELI56_00180 [Rhizobium ruizarguesonis]TAT82024.1 hypothetical protein ELI52_00180 [Rhizobium ruizarguesonis]TAT86747.1 hypothetical protein ELI54_00180 [Rhizobium ruizarguesonis]TAU29622.1 hypothetical protein ELI47_00180 [Rhizobium ruizarguesonis]